MMDMPGNIIKIADYKYLIQKSSGMNVPGLIFADDTLIRKVIEDKAYEQVANVATLRGIQDYSMAMPDIHYGYGFPIGGVAAFDIKEGIISPGGIGYDINCGVRMIKTGIDASDLGREKIKELCRKFYNNIPAGVGRSGSLPVSASELKEVLRKGASWAIERGYGDSGHLQDIEDEGFMEGADPEDLSDRALQRGKTQLGTLGAGNHFLEIQKISDIYDKETAEVFGIKKGMVTVMVHTGSRGLGYQVCDDYLKIMQKAIKKYNIEIKDRQLACAPFKSPEGQRYFRAMKCAANYAWANRQVITGKIIEILREVFSSDIKTGLVYDVCHNVGKVEEHNGKKLIVHRKGATRSFGPSRPELSGKDSSGKGSPRKDSSGKYSKTGQPVIVPGTMGTSSYVMKGTDNALEESFGSTCHGAGRVMSRRKAKSLVDGRELVKRLDSKGIILMARSLKTAAEEAPEAYKDVSGVVEVCHNAGLSSKVARARPLGVVKG
jgi:tRNA-splicing ligase RtcB